MQARFHVTNWRLACQAKVMNTATSAPPCYNLRGASFSQVLLAKSVLHCIDSGTPVSPKHVLAGVPSCLAGACSACGAMTCLLFARFSCRSVGACICGWRAGNRCPAGAAGPVGGTPAAWPPAMVPTSAGEGDHARQSSALAPSADKGRYMLACIL